MEGQKNSLEPSQDLKLKVEKPKTITGPMQRFSKRENSIGSVVKEIGYRG